MNQGHLLITGGGHENGPKKDAKISELNTTFHNMYLHVFEELCVFIYNHFY